MADPVLFPGILGEIADVIGEDLATRLAEELGGQDVVIPAIPRPGGVVASVIGVEAARLLALEIGGGRLRLPKGPTRRDHRVRALLLAGRSHREIVAAVGVHRRTVEYHAKQLRQHNRAPPPDAQLRMFD